MNDDFVQYGKDATAYGNEAAALPTQLSTEPKYKSSQQNVLKVNLSFEESSTDRYAITGKTMSDACQALPAGEAGKFEGKCNTQLTVDPKSGRVTQVTLKVNYHYTMPRWTELSQQSTEVQTAWKRFYADLLKHEQEHFRICRKHYDGLRKVLEQLTTEDRTASMIDQKWRDSVKAEQTAHTNHEGFVTSPDIKCSSYLTKS